MMYNLTNWDELLWTRYFSISFMVCSLKFMNLDKLLWTWQVLIQFMASPWTFMRDSFINCDELFSTWSLDLVHDLFMKDHELWLLFCSLLVHNRQALGIHNKLKIECCWQVSSNNDKCGLAFFLSIVQLWLHWWCFKSHICYQCFASFLTNPPRISCVAWFESCDIIKLTHTYWEADISATFYLRHFIHYFLKTFPRS